MIRKYGMVLFPAFDPQDVFGPLEVLELLAHDFQMDLYLLAETLDPVSTKPASPSMNPANSSFWPVILPSHTFADDPDLDVLIVPGGPGVRSPNLNSTMDYISRTYPKVKFLITICTGSGLVAKTGILDGRRATTNKSSWPGIVPMGPQVNWVSPARWVEDDEIWSSSGVSKQQEKNGNSPKHLLPLPALIIISNATTPARSWRTCGSHLVLREDLC